MKKYSYLMALGALLIAAGFVLLLQPVLLVGALAQEPTPEPPYLAGYFAAWTGSPHNDAASEAFVHWDAKGEIPIECAKCHSTPGYLDYLGEDGSDFRVVDAPAALGTTVNCDACHNNTAANLTSVVFPSGVEISNLGDSSRCMECHQGRSSTESVNMKLTQLGLTEDLNQVSADLGFINIHYYAAAATLYGGEVRGGYQLDGKVYQGRNLHVEGYNTCAGCHNPHTLELDVTECATCHEEVESLEDLSAIRMQGSGVDFDGDGDVIEGIKGEIETLQAMLYEAIQLYAVEVAGLPIVYDELAYPYFFIDTNANGITDEGEAAFPNKYASFTGALEIAAYNYQVTKKDPGGYTHNPLYHIQLLYDSIELLNAQIGEGAGVDLSMAYRNPPGHFDVTAEAFRHWDKDGKVAASCTRCHTAEGLPFYLENGVNIKGEPSQSLACTTCHDSVSEFSVYAVDEVTFPSGAKVSFGEGDENNMCLNCHQGRESTTSVNRAISSAGVSDDEVSDKLTFRNIHYYAAGATLFGTEVQGAYEYEGKAYNGRNLHDGKEMTTCTSCHRPHELNVRISQCEDCHEDVESTEDLALIRVIPEDADPIDYNGNGDTAEPIRDEIMSLEADLYTKIQAYASETVGVAITYDAHAHPYWFIDTNGNSTADEEEVNRDNRYVVWTPTLLRAAFNYQYIAKDPGVYVHNPHYALQILYDSLEAIGGADAVANYIRPEVIASGE